MGLFFSRLVSVFTTSEPFRVLMLGLDAAGKTTILYKVKLNESVCTIPTIGFNVETVEPVKGVTFTVWDVGGQEKIRALWRPYFHGSEGLLFVVDSADRERVNEAKEELFGILEDDVMRDVPFVVLANKQDMPNAMKPDELVEALSLRMLEKSGHPWYIQGTCAPSGQGVCEGMEAMASLVKKARHNKR